MEPISTKGSFLRKVTNRSSSTKYFSTFSVSKDFSLRVPFTDLNIKSLESSNLLNWAFNQTNQTTLVKKDQIIVNVDVWLGNKNSVNLISTNDIVSSLSFDQIQLLNSSINYSKPIPAPITKGTEYGKLIINIEGKPNITIPLVADESINKINPIFRVFSAIKYLIFGNSLNEKQ